MGEEGNKDPGPSIKPDVNDSRRLSDGAPSGPSHARRVAGNHTSDPTAPPRNNPSSRGAAQQPSQSRNFEFVLVTDNESRRQVRRHAMRQYMQQRRLDSIARLGTPRAPVGGWANNRPPSDSTAPGPSSRVEDTEEDSSPKSERHSPPSGDDEPHSPEKAKGPSRLLIPKLHKIKREEVSTPQTTSAKPSDPRASPGEGGIRDPFSCYPIPICHADHELIQHFVVTYPSMMYKFVDSIVNNPMMEIFRQFALHDGLPFQAMLAIASKHRAGVEGKTESVQSLTHKMRALRLMNERIHADSQGQHDGTIYAVATMAVIEKWSKDASIERMHFKGLASMIRNRGGMQGMRTSSPFLEKVLYWVDFSCAPKAIVSTSLPWTGVIPDTPPVGFDFISPDLHLAIPHDSTTSECPESLCDQLRACEDFLRFFRHLHELERAALSSPSMVISGNMRPRTKYFSPGTQLHSILTMLPDYDHGIRDIRFIDEYTCMSCLLFLAVALYDSYLNSTSFDQYLEWLDMEVKKLNPFTNPSITSILWQFLNNGGYPKEHSGDGGDRCWIVSRMVRIAKRLEWKRQGTIWDGLRQVLIDFILTQQECGLGSDHVDEEALVARQQKHRRPQGYFWNEDQMREDILGFKLPPATSYPEMNAPIFT